MAPRTGRTQVTRDLDQFFDTTGCAARWTSRAKGAIWTSLTEREARMHDDVVSPPSRVPDYAVAAVVVLALLASVVLFWGGLGA